MHVDELLKKTEVWLQTSQACSVIVSSRIRVARNLRHHSFPGWSDVDGRIQIWTRLNEVLEGHEVFQEGIIAQMSELSELERSLLFERHLISREMMGRGEGCGIAVSPEKRLSVMINEEDHIRIQVIQPGADLHGLWEQANDIDDMIESDVEYAYSPQLGYLTSCPTNVGTGMRASVMLHLPGLVFLQEMRPIINGLSKIGLAVRGLWGEGTEAAGHMFQVSNQVTLGETESGIIQDLEQIVHEIVQHEQNARARLMEEKEVLLRDQVGRAVGILTNARLITSTESLNLLSGLRLGRESGILPALDRKVIDELLILTQPAHLQKMANSHMNAEERDRARADLIREKLSNLKKSLNYE